MEAELWPDNDRGYRWKSALEHVITNIETADQILMELRSLHHEETRTKRMVIQDPQGRRDEAIAGGRPPDITRGAEGEYLLWVGEDVKLAPTQVLNPNSFVLLNEMKENIERAKFLRTLRGDQPLSGQSGASVRTATQQADKRYNASVDAVVEAARTAGVLALRSVAAFSREFPDAPDKIAVVAAGHGLIEVGPKDIEGWEDTLQATMKRGLRVDDQMQMNLAVAAQAAGFFSDDEIRERYLDDQAPEQSGRLVKLQALANAIFTNVLEATKTRSGALLQESAKADLAALSGDLVNLPPAIQQAVALAQQQGPPGGLPGGIPAGMPAPSGPSAAGAILQGMPAQRREGVPMAPQVTP